MDSSGAMQLLIMALAVASFLFWAVVGWRAMIAHEAIAKSLEKFARRADRPGD